MKNITRRSIAMLLFVVMLFSCCQGALVNLPPTSRYVRIVVKKHAKALNKYRSR